MKKKNGLGIFVVGAAIGASLGILFAPKSGKETRESIMKKLNELKEQVKDAKLANVREKITEKIMDIEKELKDLDREKNSKIAKQKAKTIERKATELYKLAQRKGTPMLEKTTKELKDSSKASLQKLIDKLEKEDA